MKNRRLHAACLAAVALFAAAPADATAETRTVAVRELKTASLLDGAFEFQLVKIRGYSIDVRIAGKKQKLKLGESFEPESGECKVTFRKISPETRIARFETDCR